MENLRSYPLFQQPGNEYLQPDENEDDSAHYGGLVGQAGTETPTDGKTGKTNKEGDDTNNQGGSQCHRPRVLLNGEADGQRINGCGHTLEYQTPEADSPPGIPVLPIPDAFVQHFAADIAEQD